MKYKLTVKEYCQLLEQEVALLEGKTEYYKGIPFHLDKANGYNGQQVHIHVDKYAWNQDGTRSHTRKWPNKEPSKAIKRLAAEKLGIDINLLESMMDLYLYSEQDIDDEMGLILD